MPVSSKRNSMVFEQDNQYFDIGDVFWFTPNGTDLSMLFEVMHPVNEKYPCSGCDMKDCCANEPVPNCISGSRKDHEPVVFKRVY